MVTCQKFVLVIKYEIPMCEKMCSFLLNCVKNPPGWRKNIPPLRIELLLLLLTVVQISFAQGKQDLNSKLCIPSTLNIDLIQVNLFQKHSFLNQLTNNMTTDCSLIPDFSARNIQLQNMLCTNIVFCFCFGIQTNFCTQHVLNLYFSCTEVRNQ